MDGEYERHEKPRRSLRNRKESLEYPKLEKRIWRMRGALRTRTLVGRLQIAPFRSEVIKEAWEGGQHIGIHL